MAFPTTSSSRLPRVLNLIFMIASVLVYCGCGKDDNASNKNGTNGATEEGAGRSIETLFVAIRDGDMAAVEWHLDEQPELINTPGENDTYPLQAAVFYGQVDIAILFVRRGAEIEARDAFGYTPLHYAAGVEDRSLAQLLLVEGAEINAIDDRGRTPLHWSCENGNEVVFDLLVAMNADIHARDYDKNTPLHLAAAKALCTYSGNNINNADLYHGIVAKLAKKKAEIDALNKYSRTPLHHAVLNGDLTTVRFFLVSNHWKKPAGINLAGVDSNTALDLAYEKKHSAVVDLLRRRGGKLFKELPKPKE